jgi:iron complex outermembrane receptor protein
MAGSGRENRGVRHGVSMALITAVFGSSSSGWAQTAPDGVSQEGSLQEIIVTAQKRSENIDKVPMTINAVSADQLEKAHVQDTADLARIVSGFQYAETYTGSPIYFIRGVGFYDTAFASRGTTTVYIDQVPLPLSVLECNHRS